jgi:hypothetical protein
LESIAVRCPCLRSLALEAARPIACDTQHLPIVLGADSQPLDLDRARYTPTTTQRLAVLTRQQHTCGTPHCGNQPRHIHHIWHWADGGPTNIDNLVQRKSDPCAPFVYGAQYPAVSLG